RPSSSDDSVTLHRLGRNRRLVLRFEWLTLWPTRAVLPVRSQRRDMVEILKLSGPPTAGRPICMIHAGIAGRIEAAGREVKRPVADPGTAWKASIHDRAVGWPS